MPLSFKNYIAESVKWVQKWNGDVDAKGKKIYDHETEDGQWKLELTGYYQRVGKTRPGKPNHTSWMVTQKGNKPEDIVYTSLAKAKKYVKDQYKVNESLDEGVKTQKPDTVRLYHGTHKNNIKSFLRHGIKKNDSRTDDSRGNVFLSPRPDAAFAYAVMGGEYDYIAKGGKAKDVPDKDRVLFVFDLPRDWYEKHKARVVTGSVPEVSFNVGIPSKFIAGHIVGDRQKVYKMPVTDISESLAEKTTTPQDSDIKDREGSQPKKYHAGLSKATKNARDAHFKKHGKKADDDASAYKPAPGDATAKTKPSKYTKAVNKMMDEETKGLAAKAKKSGISVGTLRKVYNRGVAAWKTGHRPGTTPQQWGHARVNAFIVKKKKGGLNHDKDLAEGNARTLSIAQRRQAARRLKRIKTRVKLGRKRALRRTPKLATLKKRAQRQTRSALFKRFSRGQAKKDVSMSRRASIERRINRLSKQRIKTMNVRQVRTARKIDRERRTSRK